MNDTNALNIPLHDGFDDELRNFPPIEVRQILNVLRWFLGAATTAALSRHRCDRRLATIEFKPDKAEIEPWLLKHLYRGMKCQI
jgi:hypothetical protein